VPGFIAWCLIALLLVGAGTFAALQMRHNQIAAKQIATQTAIQPYLDFSDEVYDTITQNYWNKITNDQLTHLYLLAANKISTSTKLNLLSKDKSGLNSLIADKIKNLPADKKKDFVTTLANVVLANLEPFGRSSLYTQASVQALNNEVNNVDTTTNLYSDLGVNKTASGQQIAQAYQQKSADLKKQSTPEAKQQLALVNRAYQALSAPQKRQSYDQTGEEPAVTYQSLGTNVYYVKISRFAPDLLTELQTAASNTPASAKFLILDLRGNIGGDIDQLSSVLGNFLGPNQNAFDFYHQGNLTPYPALGNILPQFGKFQKTVILVDNQVQSSAELMAASLKKYHYGILVGNTTRGWGTVEKVFSLQNQIDAAQTYSVFLVHSLTLNEQNQPIEGHGIKPDVDISDKNWPEELLSATNSSSLVTDVKNILNQ
jgi:hypothetical protein